MLAIDLVQVARVTAAHAHGRENFFVPAPAIALKEKGQSELTHSTPSFYSSVSVGDNEWPRPPRLQRLRGLFCCCEALFT